MSYKVTFRDKSSTVVDNDKGETLKDMLLSSRPPLNIEIAGELYRSSEIVSVKKAISTEDNIPIVSIDRLLDGNGCQGQYSIQREIGQIIKDRYKDDWPAKVQDQEIREKIRQELRLDETVAWCDHRANECACDKVKAETKV